LVSALRILGEGRLSLTKFLLVTDTPRDLKDFRGTLANVLARADFACDLLVFDQTAMDTLDCTGASLNRGSEGVLIRTGPAIRALPEAIVLPKGRTLPTGVSAVAPFCPGCLVVAASSFEAEAGAASRIASQ
jgi:3-polyprenyl-4-hydroxybenzoate decarboxylase